MKRIYLSLFLIALLPMYACSQMDKAATSNDEGMKDSLKIKSVMMKRTACYGTCPVYSVKLTRSGKAIYKGIRHVEMEGTYYGQTLNYGSLVAFIQEIDFREFKDEYTVNVTDLPGVRITVTYQNGQQKEVYSYGGEAPIEFWALTQTIDAIKNKIDWDPDGGVQKPSLNHK